MPLLQTPQASARLASTAFIVCVLSSLPLMAQPTDVDPTVAEALWVYHDGTPDGISLRPWSMAAEQRTQAAGERMGYLWLNDDCNATPWAGVTFVRTDGQLLTLTADWIAKGAIRFLINGGADRYGSPNGALQFQTRLAIAGVEYQEVSAQFIDQGRGIDEDDETWQEVVVPLSYWTGLSAGQTASSLDLQCWDQPEKSFGFAEIALVRYEQFPAWLMLPDAAEIAQPWVTWPEYSELPEILKADRRRPTVRDGAFVDPDGRRTFLLNPYCREDNRIDLWGSWTPENRPPNHGVYDPDIHGWIYDDLLTAESLCRLGFNSYSATVPAQSWWDAVGYAQRDGEADPNGLRRVAEEVGLPFYVDLVCWPWQIGMPAQKQGETALAPEAFTTGRDHWTPYRIIGPGRDAWLTLWRTYAERYAEADAEALVFELMNEPAYWDTGEAHRAEFTAWLRDRYGALEAVSATWGFPVASWEDASSVTLMRTDDPIPGRALDYDDYLSERFADLVAAGVATVGESQPNALVGLQPMGGWALLPREGVWKHRIAPLETIVLTPTGGGRWTSGATSSRAPASALSADIASAPYENDLLLALADGKMIMDNETYLSGQTALDTRNRLWQQVLAGLDGLSVFAWSKRGWSWWQTVDAVRVEADKFPYSALNPIARRTESLRGILDFAMEVQPIADDILRKPWGPEPRIGLIYDWAHARRRTFDQALRDKTADYYSALKYTHWNSALVPSDRLIAAAAPEELDVLIAGGIGYAETELPGVLESFAAAGGVVIIGEEPLPFDLYGQSLGAGDWLGVSVGESVPAEGASVTISASALGLDGDAALPVGIRSCLVAEGTEVLLADSAGRPVLTCATLGDGLVYFQAADVTGYVLGAILEAALTDAGRRLGKDVLGAWRLANIVEDDGASLAPNMLLSRRSHAEYHALLLMNRDAYARTVRVGIPGLEGSWYAREGISGTELAGDGPDGAWSAEALADGALSVALEAGAPAVIELTEARQS